MEKVMIGQVYKRANSARSFTISRVDYNDCFAYYIDVECGSECGFGELTKDGYPRNWGAWELVKTETLQETTTTITSLSSNDNVNELLSFFAQTHPGECACGMPKEQCEYHR
jgi:hypothetical protein